MKKLTAKIGAVLFGVVFSFSAIAGASFDIIGKGDNKKGIVSGPTDESQVIMAVDKNKGPNAASKVIMIKDINNAPTNASQVIMGIDKPKGPTPSSQVIMIRDINDGKVSGPTEESQVVMAIDKNKGPSAASKVIMSANTDPTKGKVDGPTEESQVIMIRDISNAPTDESKVIMIKDINNAPTEESQVIMANDLTHTINVEDMAMSNLKVFPTKMAEGKFQVNFESELIGDVKVEVFDMTGRLVYQDVKANLEGNFQESYQLPNLKSGIYIINVSKGNVVKPIKVYNVATI